MKKVSHFFPLSYKQRLLIGFLSIIIIILSLGALSQIQLTRMSDSMEKLYNHPYTVSNATEKLNFDLAAMQKSMRDILITNSKLELNNAVAQVKYHHLEIIKGFDILFERYLGDMEDVQLANTQFHQWHIIHEEIIHLARNGNIEAAIHALNTKGSIRAKALNQQVKKLNDFAHNMALRFQEAFHQQKQTTLYWSYFLAALCMAFVLILALYILSSLQRTDKETRTSRYLIDQNILLATLDKNGYVLDASNALCRFLGTNKAKLIGQESHFFDNSEKSQQVNNEIFTAILSGSEWKGEIQFLDQKGQMHWAESTIIPNFDDDYKIVKFTNILTSITNKKLSSIDTLTSLLNRRSFDEILSREMKLAQVNHMWITLAILDVDHFKKYNDRYGHPKGDEALKQVSHTIYSLIKDKHSYAFRIGGEEFAVLLVGDDMASAQKRLNNIKDEVEALNIEHDASPTGPYLTISIGAHILSHDSDVNEEAFYIKADKSLYQSKITRNTLIMSTENQ